MLLQGLGVAAIGVALADMLQWTWHTWPDILVDFGRELLAWIEANYYDIGRLPRRSGNRPGCSAA